MKLKTGILKYKRNAYEHFNLFICVWGGTNKVTCCEGNILSNYLAAKVHNNLYLVSDPDSYVYEKNVNNMRIWDVLQGYRWIVLTILHFTAPFLDGIFQLAVWKAIDRGLSQSKVTCLLSGIVIPSHSACGSLQDDIRYSDGGECSLMANIRHTHGD